MTLDPTDIRCVVRDAAAELEKAGVPEANVSAEFLLSELLEIGRAEVLASRISLSEEQRLIYNSWISRRKQREPVQRILDYAYFRRLKLELNEETLIPRSDTESVVDAALEAVDEHSGGCRVLDLGTGSGAIAISVAQERPQCEVYATDTSETALEAARRNAENAGARIQFHLGDLFAGLKGLQGKISLLVSNPPYVRNADLPDLDPEVRDWDPHPALDGGPDGLSFYRRIFQESGPLLEDGADVVLEVGDGQEKAVSELGREAGFVSVGMRQDLTGTPRAVLLKRERK
ncbi:MAG: peptide chain release factor N(5)-glutamine methyltransferase [Rubrobacteraceae bacterium]